LVQLGGQPGHIRLEPPRSAIGYGPQFIEHDGDVSRHADLIGCGRAGLSLLDGALDVNGGIAAGRPGRIRQAPDGPHGTDDDRLPIGAAGEPDRGDIVLPTAEQFLRKKPANLGGAAEGMIWKSVAVTRKTRTCWGAGVDVQFE
jgi:hypothetical protein